MLRLVPGRSKPAAKQDCCLSNQACRHSVDRVAKRLFFHSSSLTHASYQRDPGPCVRSRCTALRARTPRASCARLATATPSTYRTPSSASTRRAARPRAGRRAGSAALAPGRARARRPELEAPRLRRRSRSRLRARSAAEARRARPVRACDAPGAPEDVRRRGRAQVVGAPLPRCPFEVGVVPHWLAVDGVQPAIPENAPLDRPRSKRARAAAGPAVAAPSPAPAPRPGGDRAAQPPPAAQAAAANPALAEEGEERAPAAAAAGALPCGAPAHACCTDAEVGGESGLRRASAPATSQGSDHTANPAHVHAPPCSSCGRTRCSNALPAGCAAAPAAHSSPGSAWRVRGAAVAGVQRAAARRSCAMLAPQVLPTLQGFSPRRCPVAQAGSW